MWAKKVCPQSSWLGFRVLNLLKYMSVLAISYQPRLRDTATAAFSETTERVQFRRGNPGTNEAFVVHQVESEAILLGLMRTNHHVHPSASTKGPSASTVGTGVGVAMECHRMVGIRVQCL